MCSRPARMSSSRSASALSQVSAVMSFRNKASVMLFTSSARPCKVRGSEPARRVRQAQNARDC